MSTGSVAENVRGVTDTTIKIGMIADMTGPGTSVTGILGDLNRNYVRYINDRGGIHGRKVIGLLEDDRLSIPLGIAAFKKLVFRDKVFAMLGPANTPSAKALFNRVEKLKIPNMALIPQEIVVKPLKRYIFMTMESYDDDFGVIFDYIFNEEKPENIKMTFVTYDGESGKETWEYVKKWAQVFNYTHPIERETMEILQYTPEHEAFRKRLKDFLAAEVTPRVEEFEANHIVPKELWRRMGEEGFLCISMPQEFGGHGLDFLYSIIVVEEMSYTWFL